MSDDDSDSDSMMRSMMGFSSFGTQRPAGKKASDAPPSTGSNAAPVTKRAKTGAAPTAIAPIMPPSRISPSSSLSKTKPALKTAPATTARSARPAAPGATTTSTTTFQSATPAPPGPSTTQPIGSPSDPNSASNNASTTANLARPSDSSRSNIDSTTNIAYTSPTNPTYRLTFPELNALRNGRINIRGDTVFFKPGFIDENPWKTLQEIAGEAETSGGMKASEARHEVGKRRTSYIA